MINEDAVHNFLGTLSSDSNYLDNLSNLEMDARLYEWDQATINAIYRGIKTHNEQNNHHYSDTLGKT